MKKVEKTTRPFRYDLNQIPYDYTVEVTNRFKELYLIDRVPEKQWMEVHGIIQDWDGKVGSQELPGVTGKFGLGVQNEAKQSKA